MVTERQTQTSRPASSVARHPWDLEVQYLKGVGEKIAELLGKADIRTLWDLLLTLPRTYEDRREFHDYKQMCAAVATGQPVMSRGVIERFIPKNPGRGGRRWTEAVVRVLSKDPVGGEGLQPKILFTFFNDFGGSLAKRYPPDTPIIFRGKVQEFRGQLQIVHPEISKADLDLPEWERGFVPVYREVLGLSTRLLRRILALALERPELKSLPEGLPRELCERFKFAPLAQSLKELHFPRSWKPEGAEPVPSGIFFDRVVFEELFMMAFALHFRRAEWKIEDQKRRRNLAEIQVDIQKLAQWKSLLPFELTGDQSRSLHEVFEDMSLKNARVPMHRLVQGDVGSGKTVVAFLAALAAIDSGYQVALMAPTEILADQHYNTFAKLFPERVHEAVLLKGALKARGKKDARAALEMGTARFVIGTQALLTDTTIFEKLGLVIVDEQHRFGVEQRLGLKHQGEEIAPHLLVMTATPIPRSLALTLYGDLSLSVIREKPVGRKPIATHLVKRKSHRALVTRLKTFLEEGRQIYIVYPLVEESEELDLKDVQNAFKEWKVDFPETSIGLLHGRMKSADKDAAMRAFKSGETRVLVATTAIEVGVDVPNATVIVIEHAERFGLSQLHQLRGRVGRGSQQSYCVLVGPDNMGPLSEERLRTMEQSDDGFFIAEKDLDLRGPGEFLGRRQSGLPGFRVAHILRDVNLMQIAREEARKILNSDPKLHQPENQKIRLLLEKWWKGRMELTLSG